MHCAGYPLSITAMEMVVTMVKHNLLFVFIWSTRIVMWVVSPSGGARGDVHDVFPHDDHGACHDGGAPLP